MYNWIEGREEGEDWGLSGCSLSLAEKRFDTSTVAIATTFIYAQSGRILSFENFFLFINYNSCKRSALSLFTLILYFQTTYVIFRVKTKISNGNQKQSALDVKMSEACISAVQLSLVFNMYIFLSFFFLCLRFDSFIFILRGSRLCKHPEVFT